MGKHLTPWSPLIHTSVSTHLVPVSQLVGFNTIITCWPPILSSKESTGNRCCCCSVTQSCPALCDHMGFETPCSSMDCNMPGFSVLHCLPEFVQTHVPWVSDAIQPSHPLSPASPPALNLSQHQGLFQWVGSSHQVAKVLELQLLASLLPMNIQSWFHLDWLVDLLAVQGTIKNLLQHYSF